MEHDEQAERLEREADKLEEEGERVGDQIDDTMNDWESKEQDPSVPGAQPDEDRDDATDEGLGASREEAEENPGGADEEDQATGNPDAAGDSDPEESG